MFSGCTLVVSKPKEIQKLEVEAKLTNVLVLPARLALGPFVHMTTLPTY